MAAPHSELITTLQDITGIAQSIKSYIRERQSISPRHQSSALATPIPSLQFPHPHEILSCLHSLGLQPSTLEEASRRVLQTLREYEDAHNKNYMQTCETLRNARGQSSLAEVFLNLRQAYQNSFSKRYMPWIKSQIQTTWATTCRASPHHNEHEKKRAFNTEYTPLLETYFQYNAYPSVPDRLMLARKTMMKPRQIEVWFQNHRNRARKEGKVPRRLSSNPLPVEISVESLSRRMPLFTIPKCERAESVDVSDDENSQKNELPNVKAMPIATEMVDVLNVPAPDHAFPMSYPPKVSYRPFPTSRSDRKFPHPVWQRTSSSVRRDNIPIDLDEFTASFAAKLNLRESSKPRKKLNVEHLSNLRSDRNCWFSATVTTPSPAPHPALIRGSAPRSKFAGSSSAGNFLSNSERSTHQPSIRMPSYTQSASYGSSSCSRHTSLSPSPPPLFDNSLYTTEPSSPAQSSSFSSSSPSTPASSPMPLTLGNQIDWSGLDVHRPHPPFAHSSSSSPLFTEFTPLHKWTPPCYPSPPTQAPFLKDLLV